MFGTSWCGGTSVAGWLLMTALWGGFLAVVIWAVLRLFPSGRLDLASQQPPAAVPGAAGLLDQRLAAGEIDEDTYLRLRGELSPAR